MRAKASACTTDEKERHITDIEHLAVVAERLCAEHGDNGKAHLAELPRLWLLRKTISTTFEAMVYDPVFCLILRGRKETTVGDRSLDVGAGDSLLISHDLPVVARITEASPAEPYLSLVMLLDFGTIRGLYDQVGEAEPESSEAHSLDSHAADEALLSAVGRYLALADQPLEAAVLAPLILKEIHFRLLMAPNGGMLRNLLSRDSHASRISKAIAHIRQSYKTALPVTDIARVAGMSPSSFHEHFRSITGTTPLQFQKDLRLIEARRLLSQLNQPVAATAFEVGYESPAQFSREYSRKFGTPPKEDIGKVAIGV